MNSGTTMPVSSPNSDLKQTNKHIINSSTQLCQLRLGGKQHIAQAQECKRYTKHSQHRRETRWWTPNSRLGARETERRAAVLTLEPQSSASSPAENKSTILGAARSELHIQQAHSLLSSPLLLLLSSPLQLLDKFADVNKHSVSAAKALWWNNTWKRRGKTRPERPGEAAMYVRGCSCKTRAEKIYKQTSQKISPPVIIKNIYIM